MATYSKDGGMPKADYVEYREIRPFGGPGLLEYTGHERNTDWWHRGEVTMEGLRRLVNPVRADGACAS